ncbi:MAG: class I SAM-dependent methyltransferase [Maricaulaceae bacterium]
MTNHHSQDWNNYWQGRSASEGGNALTGVGIENNAVLSSFWQKTFKPLPQTARLVDFACGAGSVLKHAHNANMKNLTGIDISGSAIDVLTDKYPSIKGVVCPVDRTPFNDREFDIIVSQFGFEYAGGKNQRINTTKEMVRILKPSGKIVLIAHIKNGAIMRDCQTSLDQINMIAKSQFFKIAQSTFIASHNANNTKSAHDKNKAESTMKRLNQASKPLLDWLKEENLEKNDFAKFIYYLLQSSNKLLQNYHKYTPSDGKAWFDGMERETFAYKGRMSSMIDAALSQQDAQALLDTFETAGLTSNPLEKLHFPQERAPIAWKIQTA